MLTLRFNTVSDFTFTIPKSIDGGTTTVEAYSSIKVKRLIYIDNIGYFMIVTATESSDGQSPALEVECKSIEMELSFKKISSLNGTFRFYNSIIPSTNPVNSLMGYVVSLIPGWSIGGIDTSLELKYRTFAITDTTIYEFLMNDLEKAYDCVFLFDIATKKIYARTIENATTTTDIFLSYDNLIQNSTFSELSDEIVTALNVYGGGDIDIRTVNPLGTNLIYDFSYYKNTDWMTSSTASAITRWENLIQFYRPSYSQKLVDLINYNYTTASYTVAVNNFEIAYAQKEIELKSAIETSASTVAILTAQLNAIQVQINTYTGYITTYNGYIETTSSAIRTINSALSFSNNFTAGQYVELNNYIIENTYQNNNITVIDSMSASTVQIVKQELYDVSGSVLRKVAVPRYEFSFSTTNFLALQEFQYYSNQLVVGAKVYVQTDTLPIETVLLELGLSYDNPENFRLTFSNRLRLDNGKFQYSDLVGEVVKTGTSVSFNNSKWSNWEDNYKDDVTTFINSALNTTNNELINSSNQEIVINGAGLRGKRYDSATNSYSSSQVWLTSNTLAFTGNNWQTSSLALGSITVNGIKRFGLVGDVVVGRILAGNSLTITNDNGSGLASTFTLDQNGARLVNSTFTINKTSGGILNSILISPSDGLKITAGGVTKFLADLSGNVTLSGTINSTSGNIGGWQINTNGLFKDANTYINSDGNIKLGSLTITPTSSTFSGALSAATGTFSGSLVAAIGTFAGSLSAATGTFTGSLSAATGTFSGKVTATSGSIGGWQIDSEGLISPNANYFIKVDTGGYARAVIAGLSLLGTSGNGTMSFTGVSSTISTSTTLNLLSKGAANFGNGNSFSKLTMTSAGQTVLYGSTLQLQNKTNTAYIFLDATTQITVATTSFNMRDATGTYTGVSTNVDTTIPQTLRFVNGILVQVT
jgi:hypothetical protein